MQFREPPDAGRWLRGTTLGASLILVLHLVQVLDTRPARRWTTPRRVGRALRVRTRVIASRALTTPRRLVEVLGPRLRRFLPTKRNEARTLRITAASAMDYEMPLKRPYGTARGTTKSVRNFLVTIDGTASDGSAFEGQGECQPRHVLTGDGPRHGPMAWNFLCEACLRLKDAQIDITDRTRAVASIREVIADIEELAREHADETNLDKPFRGTLLGIEVALLDIAGRSLDCQISDLLGRHRDDIGISIATISTANSPERVAEKAAKQVRFPVTRLKGSGDVDRDVELVQLVADVNHAQGMPKPIWMDINEASTAASARELIARLVSLMAEGELPNEILLEGLLPKADFLQLADLQAYADELCLSHGSQLGLRLFIMADEGLWDSADVSALASRGGCRALNLKAPKAGGLLECVEMVDIALQANPDVRISVGGMLGTSDLTAFALHNLGRSLPRLDYITATPPGNVKARIARPRARYAGEQDNTIAPQNQSGLGTKVDHVAVAPFVRHRFTTRGQSASATLVFGGDTSLGDKHHQARGGEAAGLLESDPMYFLRGLAPLTMGNDHLIVNFESILGDSPVSPLEGKKKYLGWDQPDRTVRCFQELGVTAVGMANNHAMDFGRDQMLASADSFRQAGIKVFGVGSDRNRAEEPLRIPLTFEGDVERSVFVFGVKAPERKLDELGFFAEDSSAGVARLELERLTAAIREVKREDPSSYVIVYPHWNYDYKWPNPKLRRWAKQIAMSGADAILGHGTHMLSDFDTVEGSHVVWSLGNFQFNWAGRHDRMPDAVPYSLVARLQLSLEEGQWRADLKLYPTRCDNRAIAYQPRPVSAEEAEEVVEILNTRSPDSATGHTKVYECSRDDFGWFVRRASRGQQQSPPADSAVEGPLTYVEGLNLLTHKESDSHLVSLAALERGHSVRRSSGTAFAMETATATVEFRRSRFLSPQASSVVRVTSDKQATRNRLAEAKVPIAAGAEFDSGDAESAVAFAQRIGWPVVVKPSKGTGGVGVSAGLTSAPDVRQAIRVMATNRVSARRNPAGRFVVEKHIDGLELRVYVVGDEALSAILKRQAFVVGDGNSSVAALMALANEERAGNPRLAKTKLKKKESTRVQLARQGLTYQSVPDFGRTVTLSTVASVSQGGESVNVIHDAHPEILAMAVEATRAVPGLDMAGVDLIVQDYRKPAQEQQAIVLELNSSPSILTGAYPLVGPSVDLGGAIVDLALERSAARTSTSTRESGDFDLAVEFDARHSAGTGDLLTRLAARLGLGVLTVAVRDSCVEMRLRGDSRLADLLAAFTVSEGLNIGAVCTTVRPTD